MLVQFLRTEDGFKQFEEHLRTEFAVENLLCWSDIEQYRRQPSQQKAIDIYRTYLSAAAPLEVNLASSTNSYYRTGVFAGVDAHRQPYGPRRNGIAAWLSPLDLQAKAATAPLGEGGAPRQHDHLHAPVDLFDRASQELIRLMECDSLLRFSTAHPEQWNLFDATFRERNALTNAFATPLDQVDLTPIGTDRTSSK